ncbi:MAG: type II toxin-antitoxin system RelB/DinJ family antitoxin [Candidatus Ancillula sp.]|jgi:DNA-damage-inducible protein J|nr:type II toxin-antitoxin system RelB/DinJ family antitoxin [Candidatus Ancillula sp.]
MSTISFRLDDQTRVVADSYLSNLGLTMSGYLNMAVKQLVNQRGIPFETKVTDPYDYTREEYFAMLDEGIKEYESNKFEKHDLIEV